MARNLQPDSEARSVCVRLDKHHKGTLYSTELAYKCVRQLRYVVSLKKTVLCYGDSNTWGYVPGSGARFPKQQRWPGILQRTLGAEFDVIEEGLSGRTTDRDDPLEPGRNGLASLRPTLDARARIDLVILMLGTNDLKHHIGASARDTARGISRLVDVVSGKTGATDGVAPHILIVSPPAICARAVAQNPQFRKTAKTSRKFAKYFANVAKEKQCMFFDAGQFVAPSPIDGIHLDADGHARLAESISKAITEIFNQQT